MNVLRYCFLIVFIVSVSDIYGQEAYEIAGLQLMTAVPLVKQTDASFDRLEERLDNEYNFKHKKECKKELNEYRSHVIESINDGTYFRDDIIYPYVRELIDELTSCNDLNLYGINLLLSVNNSANAFCLVDGTIIVTIGLLIHMENREQLKSILAHELSHDILGHGYGDLLDDIRKKSSKAYKQQVKDLSKQKYNRGKASLDVLKKDRYQAAVKSRLAELAADSLGYQLYVGCDGSAVEFLKALQLRSEHDTLTYAPLAASTYIEVLSNDKIVFDTTWLEMEDYSSYVYHDEKEVLNSDSIRTHPSDSIRVGILQSAHQVVDTIRAPFDSAYVDIARQAYRHLLPSLIKSERLEVALYYILYNTQRGYERDNYKDYLKLIFSRLAEARRDYKYNRYVETINPRIHEPEQQQLLSFLWNLRSQDLEYLAEHL